MKTLKLGSDHTVHVKRIVDQNEVKALQLLTLQHGENYTTFYKVRNFDENGVVFFYLGKGHQYDREQIVAWYPNGRLWGGFGRTFLEAIEGAQKDGWQYAV